MELEVVSDRSNKLEVTGKSEIHKEMLERFYHVHVKSNTPLAVHGISYGNRKKVTYVSWPSRHPVHCLDKQNRRSPSQRSLLGLLSLAKI